MTYTHIEDNLYICDGCDKEMDVEVLIDGSIEITCLNEKCKHLLKRDVLLAEDPAVG